MKIDVGVDSLVDGEIFTIEGNKTQTVIRHGARELVKINTTMLRSYILALDSTASSKKD